MRVFWIIIGVLTLLTLGLTWQRSRNAPDGLVTFLMREGLNQAAPAPTPPAPTGDESPADTDVADNQPEAVLESSTEDDINTVEDEADDSIPVIETPDEQQLPDEQQPSDEVDTSDASETSPQPTEAVDAAEPDDAQNIDDRFIIRGEGTKENPYQVSWNLLISAAETYQPRQGKTELPEWVDTLNGHYTVVTGFLMLPMMGENQEELLVMLNEWDGCCIGVPPSPYDAVEVTLLEPVTREVERAGYGAVKGRLLIEPYLFNDWLVGLYVMDEATVESVP